MNKKILWKIDELWKRYLQPEEKGHIDISQNYTQGVSRYHSRFHLVNKFNFTKSADIVFSDDYGEYKGLEKCQVLESDKKIIYLFDNHNEMIYPIVEIFESVKMQYDIVHIDAHPDDAQFDGDKLKEINLETAQGFIQKTRISDFFDAISDANIIGDIYRITHSDSLEFFLPPEKPYILSLDIDIFGPEGDFAELKDKVRAIAVAWGNADAVCIATSPGFIDQEFAKDIIQILVK